MVGIHKRDRLRDADLVEFVKRASAATPNVRGLVDYTWRQAEAHEKVEVSVHSESGPSLTIPFRDILAAHDGVFYFGWNEASQIAVWKWNPLVVPGRDSEGWRITQA